MASEWINFVKEYQLKHGITYREALKKAKEPYRKSKGKKMKTKTKTKTTETTETLPVMPVSPISDFTKIKEQEEPPLRPKRRGRRSRKSKVEPPLDIVEPSASIETVEQEIVEPSRTREFMDAVISNYNEMISPVVSPIIRRNLKNGLHAVLEIAAAMTGNANAVEYASQIATNMESLVDRAGDKYGFGMKQKK